MSPRRDWSQYHPQYRSREMRVLASWIAAGKSGSVVGSGGSGKSNVLGFLAGRPDVLETYLPDGVAAATALVDVNSLPQRDLSTFYRLLLRAFHSARERLGSALAADIDRIYRENLAAQDPFVAQAAVIEWFEQATRNGLTMVIVMDRFDGFLTNPDARFTDGLRALRDAYKGRLSYIVGMREPIQRQPLADRLGELQELLDTNVCWVGPMSDDDARRMVEEELRDLSLVPQKRVEESLEGATGTLGTGVTDQIVTDLLSLTGGYPSIIRALCDALTTDRLGSPLSSLAHPESIAGLTTRLDEIVQGLDEGEVKALAAVAAGDRVDSHHPTLMRLSRRGLVWESAEGWRVRGQLLALYVARQGGGGIRRDESTGEVIAGRLPVTGLAPLEQRLLDYLLERPGERVSKTELIEGTWPSGELASGVSDDALYQVVRGVRKRIEPELSRPKYLVTWRGHPEGGYQLFPNGNTGD